MNCEIGLLSARIRVCARAEIGIVLAAAPGRRLVFGVRTSSRSTDCLYGRNELD